MFTGIVLIEFLTVVFFAASIQASLGFGYSIFAMMFFPQLFATYPQAAAVSSFMTVMTSTTVAYRLRQHIRWRILAPCVVGYMIISPVAVWMSTILEKDLLERMLGGMLVVLGLYFIFLGGKIRVRPTVRNGVIAGVIAGIGGGFFAVGGPPLVVYMLSALDDKVEYSASMQTTLMLVGLYSAFIRILNGIFTVDLVVNMAIGFVVMFIGASVGCAVMKKLPADTLRKIIYAFMVFSGLKMLFGF